MIQKKGEKRKKKRKLTRGGQTVGDDGADPLEDGADRLDVLPQVLVAVANCGLHGDQARRQHREVVARVDQTRIGRERRRVAGHQRRVVGRRFAHGQPILFQHAHHRLVAVPRHVRRQQVRQVWQNLKNPFGITFSIRVAI